MSHAKNKNISKKKINILILSHSFLPFIGGIEIMTLFLGNTFVNAGYNVKVMTWTEEINNEKLLFEVIRKPSLFTVFREYIWSDLVFENNPALRLSWPVFLFRKPLITVLHTWVSRTDGSLNWQDKLKNLCLRRSNKIIAVSHALRKKSLDEALVIHNPFRVDEFKIIDGIKRSNDFVFLGRLVSDKGIHLTILALNELFKLGYKMNLTIIGEGPEMNSLKQLAIDTGLNHYINFTGILKGNNLVEMLNKHKFILVPSIWEEPFGLVALEGMACGCIPIVSDGGGLPEAVGEAGLTFKRGDLSSLVCCIETLLMDSSLQNELKNASSNHLMKHHPNIIGKSYLEVVNNVLMK